MIPTHIAFIMDGNGRWAERRRLPRKIGHKMGTEALKRVVKAADASGVRYVTFYAFSTENWSRPQEEIDFLMDRFRSFLKKNHEFEEKGYRLVFIGNLGKLPVDIQESCTRLTAETSNHKGLTIVIALNYGSWEEITTAVNALIESGKREITSEDIRAALYTRDIPFPDLIVRTGGELRLSNFLLLQSAYSELIFTPTLWPDFNRREWKKILDEYASRVRKFGGLGGSQC